MNLIVDRFAVLTYHILDFYVTCTGRVIQERAPNPGLVEGLSSIQPMSTVVVGTI